MSKLIVKPIKVEKNIWVPVDGMRHIWENTETGEFFYEDETQDLNGPYISKEEAERQLKLYCESVLGPRVI